MAAPAVVANVTRPPSIRSTRPYARVPSRNTSSSVTPAGVTTTCGAAAWRSPAVGRPVSTSARQAARAYRFTRHAIGASQSVLLPGRPAWTTSEPPIRAGRSGTLTFSRILKSARISAGVAVQAM